MININQYRYVCHFLPTILNGNFRLEYLMQLSFTLVQKHLLLKYLPYNFLKIFATISTIKR